MQRFAPWLFLLLIGAAGSVRAEGKPLWEAGVGVFPVWVPDYRGSDESRLYALPLPYVVYRGDLIKVDRSGIYSRLFESGRVNIDLSADAGAPVDSSKNRTRSGMPDLDTVFELGPSLEVCLWKRCDGERVLQFRLPVRAVFSTDFSSIESIGGTVHPNLNLDIKNIGPGGGWNFGMAAGPLYASERLHDYYYQVDPAFATATRPAYDARAGYSGVRVTGSLSKRFRRMWFGAFARYDDLAATAFEDSPLVRVHRSFMTGFGIAWIAAESEQRARVRD